ncbi:MAG: hypothetical protein ABFC63_10085 [Thermoguttaceae bacterium]
MPTPENHLGPRPYLENLMRRLPGFRGYLDRDARRESDELHRNWIADRLQRSKRAIDELGRQLADAGALDALPQLDRVRARLDRLLGRIAGAMQGYTGFFDLVRIDVPLLDRIYQHDQGLDERVEALTQAIEQLPGKCNEPSACVSDLLAKMDEIERAWDDREDMLKGVK